MAVPVTQHGVDTVGVLGEAGELDAVFDSATELFYLFSKNFLGDVLRQHQQIGVRRVEATQVEKTDRALLGIEVELAHGQAAANRRVDHTEAFKELQRSGLQAKRFGAHIVMYGGVGASHRHAATSQLRGSCQADRAGPS